MADTQQSKGGPPPPENSMNDLMTSAMKSMYRAKPLLPLDPSTLALFRWSRPDLYNLVGRTDDSSVNQQEREKQEQQLVDHIVTTRDAVLKEKQYPCLAAYSFLVPGIIFQDPYKQAVQLLRNRSNGRRPTFLDLGCGLGQDLRALICPDLNDAGVGGVQASQCVGADLLPSLMQAGFELFGDEEEKGWLEGAKWEQTDVFKQEDLDRLKALTDKGEGYDVIFLGSFLHLFSLPSQLRCMAALDHLLSRRPGSIIFGKQTGCAEAYNVRRKEGVSIEEDPQAEVFRHDEKSFRAMVETGTVPPTSGQGEPAIDLAVAAAQQRGGFNWRCEVDVWDMAVESAGKDPRRNAGIKKGEGWMQHDPAQSQSRGEADPEVSATAAAVRKEQGQQIKSLHFCITRL